MKIIEVRDGFIKFEADNSIYLSSFIKVDGEDKSYIAQVIQQKEDVAFAKILFLYSEGQLQNYDKTLPSVDSNMSMYTSEILNNAISYENPIIIGKTKDNQNIVIDSSAFDKKTIISVDNRKSNNILVQNLTKQFNNLGKRTLVIDTLGIISADNKYTAGIDFKLPLDKESLKFMYEDCLNDATADSKSTIIDIFKELAEYSETVPFVPFNLLKTVVNNMVEKDHIFKLLVLKNKLSKFDKLGYFASEKKEVDKIYEILGSKNVVIDLSKLNVLFQNRYISYIYDQLNNSEDIQAILELSNTVSKKNLKKTMTSDVHTVFFTHSNFSYLNDIKNFFDNFVIFPSISNNQIFRIYVTFLKAIDANSYLTVGEATNYIPFVSKVQAIEETISAKSSLLPAQDDEVIEADISSEEEVLKEQEEENPSLEGDTSTVNYLDSIIANQEPQSEVFSAIDEKSESAIAEVTEDLQMPTEIDMFTEDNDDVNSDDNSDDNSDAIELSENIEEISDETIVQEEIPEYDNVELEEESNETLVEEHPLEDEPIEIITEDALAETESDETIQMQEDLPSLEEDSPIEISEDAYVALEDSDELQLNDDTLSVDDDQLNSINESDDLQNIEIQEISEDTNIESQSEESVNTEEISMLNPSDENYTEEIQVDNNDELDFEEIVELDPSETDASDIIVDLEDGFSDSIQEEREEEIVKEVDKVFTTRQGEEEFSDSDLDFIDELNNDEGELLAEAESDEALLQELGGDDESGILHEEQEDNVEEIKEYEPEILEKRDSSTPIVPVYDADIPQEDIVESDPIEQGDSVVHAKYGNGVVEKMIKYGNKTLYSINFENIGRRLLDPTLTEIKKS